jgi:hypothetical protein
MNKYHWFISLFIIMCIAILHNKATSRYETVEQLDYQQEFKFNWDYPLSVEDKAKLNKIVNNYLINLTPIRKKMLADIISEKELILLDHLIYRIKKNLDKGNAILELSREEQRDFIYFHNKKIFKYLHKLQMSDLR